MRLFSVVTAFFILVGCAENQVATLSDISDKKINDYSIEDCELLLSSSLTDIGQAYNIDMTMEPSSGLLLTGNTLATPITALSGGVIITATSYSDLSQQPFSLILYGDVGDKTPLHDLTYHMKFDASNYDNVIDSFYKVSEKGDEYAAKIVKLEQDGLAFELNFELQKNTFVLRSLVISKDNM